MLSMMCSKQRGNRPLVHLHVLISAIAVVHKAAAFVCQTRPNFRAMTGEAFTVPTTMIRRQYCSRSCYPNTAVSSFIMQTALSVHSVRDADIVEVMVGGERYSLVPMPDSMKSTTVFVGNVCEFVKDEDLSGLFSEVSSVLSVPSCVVRKVNTQSLGYGFVSFPSVKEKEVRSAFRNDRPGRNRLTYHHTGF
jgi:RNA recognition motif. (a.k.a. RRM, RBD, or RNP domain)